MFAQSWNLTFVIGLQELNSSYTQLYNSLYVTSKKTELDLELCVGFFQILQFPLTIQLHVNRIGYTKVTLDVNMLVNVGVRGALQCTHIPSMVNFVLSNWYLVLLG